MSLPFPVPSSTLFSKEKASNDTRGNTMLFYHADQDVSGAARAGRSSGPPSVADVLNKILKISPNVIIVTNQWGIITSFNSTAEQLFGFHEDEVVGKKISSLF